MKSKKRYSINKSAGYAVLSTAAFASLVLVPSAVAHADVNFSGTTSLKGEVVITTQVQLTDATANGSLKDAKVIIDPVTPGMKINLGSVKVNNIEIKKSVKLKGNNLSDAKIVLNPVNGNSVIDLSGVNATNIIIANNNVKQITVADNITSISKADGVTAADPIILDKDGKAKEDVTVIPEKSVVDTKVLKTAITNAEIALEGAEEGTKVGQYPKGSIKTLQDAIKVAQAVVADKEADQKAVDAASEKLNAAVEVFKSGKVSDGKFNLSIMHVNDIHASTDKAPKLVTAVNEVRAAKPDALLLNAGDVFSGTLYFNEFKGMADLAFMNLMKVDAMTFGNHEFDLGSSAEGHKALADFIKAANFPFVSANVDFSKDPLFDGLFNTKISTTPKNSNIYAGIVKEIDGEKVGIFGLTTAETKDIASPGEITFSNYIEDAERMVAEFEAMGVNKIVAITHIGFDDNAAMDNDQELAKHVDGIDVIVGGHSHTQLDKPVVVDKDEKGAAKDQTIIVQAYQYSDYLGTLDVEFDEKGVVIGHAGKLIATKDKKENAEAVELLKPYKDKIAAVNEEEIGVTLETTLETPRTGEDNSKPSVRKNETILGNLITDGMLAKAQDYAKDKKVIMAFQNGGGIRAGIGAGPITVGEVITVLPFGNTLATMDVTGAELKETFEISFKEYPKENGGFLHVSGAKVEFDSSKPAGQRVVSISYKNANGSYTEIEDAKTYTVATNAFTAKGGDGYDVLKKAYEAGRVTDLGLSDWENLREHLVSLGNKIPTEIEGRIIDVAAVVEEPDTEDVAGEDFSGTVDKPKVYNGNVTVSVTDVVSFENVTVKGNLILTGTPTENVSFANITVEGDLDLTGLDSDVFGFDGITVAGETRL
ncbi:5'-nucleotidase C-terminal domain-containing protein [Sporosarcina sp. FSL K6-1540]|uniref:bifunctional metallophosphatase/5'-nucleotidase n=1 Tax=Sporosarcina sp. FSL K6-1540 TaxID=2921555 RepID=UPI00315A4FE3